MLQERFLDEVEFADDEYVAKLRDLLSYHVVTDGMLTSGQLRDGMKLNTLLGGHSLAVRQYSSVNIPIKNQLLTREKFITLQKLPDSTESLLF